MLGNPVKSE